MISLNEEEGGLGKYKGKKRTFLYVCFKKCSGDLIDGFSQPGLARGKHLIPENYLVSGKSHQKMLRPEK